MPSYKVTYFPVKALAEPIRMILSYAGQEFEDDRFDREDWPTKIKPTMPFGQVPVLEVDGKRINQSTAICRYLAKQYGLVGKDDWENLEIDSTVDTIHDMRSKIAGFFYEDDTNAEAKAKKKEVALKETVPFYLERLDAQVKKNNGYFVGGKLTWADFVFVGIIDYLNAMAGYNIIDKYDNLKSLNEKVLALPKIKEWVAKRPDIENFKKMPSYKLTYFNITGLGEPIRYLLSYGGVDFEDKRVSFDEWPALKSQMPMGQMPLLEIDGKKYNQSQAILRYLAKKFKVAGGDDDEAYEIDNAVDTMADMRIALATWHFEADAAAKERQKEKAFSKMDLVLGKLEETVKKNSGYLVRGKLSWADISLAAYNDFLSKVIGKSLVADYPELKKLIEKVSAVPNIKKYLEKRPVTQM
ncbi:hypothetical protein HCN44_002768 [Aphidius gifuensis]|uniref:glutathione transferase n=1 Tax=Aphidius gifuensis TaxID=684658 RepID=A0A834XS47_APHGI|nr:hypothetical protein HCN44_002768 [Aphidius gifuensis]